LAAREPRRVSVKRGGFRKLQISGFDGVMFHVDLKACIGPSDSGARLSWTSSSTPSRRALQRGHHAGVGRYRRATSMPVAIEGQRSRSTGRFCGPVRANHFVPALPTSPLTLAPSAIPSYAAAARCLHPSSGVFRSISISGLSRHLETQHSCRRPS